MEARLAENAGASVNPCRASQCEEASGSKFDRLLPVEKSPRVLANRQFSPKLSEWYVGCPSLWLLPPASISLLFGDSAAKLHTSFAVFLLFSP